LVQLPGFSLHLLTFRLACFTPLQSLGQFVEHSCTVGSVLLLEVADRKRFLQVFTRNLLVLRDASMYIEEGKSFHSLGIHQIIFFERNGSKFEIAGACADML
jgi:hypothetical protein